MTSRQILALIHGEEGLCAARDFLSGALRMENGIALQLSRLDQMRKKLRQGQGSAAAVEAGEASLLSSYAALREKQREIGAVLRRIPGDRPREVLERRYLQGQPFFRIAMEMHYDERQIYRLHRQGLAHVAARIILGLIAEASAASGSAAGASGPCTPPGDVGHEGSQT